MFSNTISAPPTLDVWAGRFFFLTIFSLKHTPHKQGFRLISSESFTFKLGPDTGPAWSGVLENSPSQRPHFTVTLSVQRQCYSGFCSGALLSGTPALRPLQRWTRRVAAWMGSHSGEQPARARPGSAGERSRGVPARRRDSLRGHVEAHVAVFPQHVQHRHGA